MKTAKQARLTRNIEYQLADRWIEVPCGTIVHFCAEAQAAYVHNENELFHCSEEHVEPFEPCLTLLPAANTPAASTA